MRSARKKLEAMYAALHKHFGHQAWWPGDTPLEVCVGAILTQNTNWQNVERALANLKAAGRLSLKALARTSAEELAELIRPAGYFNVKARRLGNFVRAVMDQGHGSLGRFLDRPVGPLREALLAVNGIGPETADSIILYAAGKASFVVDAYTCRVLVRHGLAQPGAGYEDVQQLFESSLRVDVAFWNDFHAQFVAVGKHFCRPRGPRCGECPLRRFRHDPTVV